MVKYLLFTKATNRAEKNRVKILNCALGKKGDKLLDVGGKGVWWKKNPLKYGKMQKNVTPVKRFIQDTVYKKR